MRFNQFLAHAGVCSRRKADQLIQAGKVTVNGKVVTTPAYRVAMQDQVVYEKCTLRLLRKRYLILHKPLNTITTLRDPQQRRTVMDVLGSHIAGYGMVPVGRLDRNTTGVLLCTNDGVLAHALAHPSSKVPKCYRVTLNKPFKYQDRQRLRRGIILEDGRLTPDKVVWRVDVPTMLEITLHSGKNRVIRRLFATLGYRVKALERVNYAALNIEALPTGRWRWLTDDEVGRLRKDWL